MELKQVRYFVGVCEAGSLLKASARLHIAQPTVGQRLQVDTRNLQSAGWFRFSWTQAEGRYLRNKEG